jgi:hypothetical protein
MTKVKAMRRTETMSRIDKLLAVVTSFAYREEYFSELGGMLATIQKHHPAWHVVSGKGPVPGFNSPTFEVASPQHNLQWSLPVSFQLDGTEKDWHRIVFMKGWWMAQVWHQLSTFASSDIRRIIWLDADGRLNGPLDIELDPEAEIIASPWWTDPGTPEHEHHICSGLLIFQGRRGGPVERVLDAWAADCLDRIAVPLMPSAFLPGPEGDQCLLTKIVKNNSGEQEDYGVLKLSYEKYCGVPDNKTNECKPGALVHQWMMNKKMRRPEDRGKDWPPPEEARRNPPVRARGALENR